MSKPPTDAEIERVVRVYLRRDVSSWEELFNHPKLEGLDAGQVEAALNRLVEGGYLRQQWLDDKHYSLEPTDVLRAWLQEREFPKVEWSDPATLKTWGKRFKASTSTLYRRRTRGTLRMREVPGTRGHWQVHVEDPLYKEWQEQQQRKSY